MSDDINKDLKGIISDKDKIIVAKDSIISNTNKKYFAAEDKYKVSFQERIKLTTEVKHLKGQVRLYKGLTIGLPAAGLGAFLYFKYR